MLPLRRILCPTDFSDFSYQALEKAGELASHFGAELCVLHVKPPIATPTYVTPSRIESLSAQEAATREKVEREVGQVTERYSFPNAVVIPLSRTGDPADGIIRAAEEERADLIVISTHGLSGWRQNILGSVAETVLRLAHCPVLLRRVSPEEHPGLAIPPRKIVCSTDFSEPSLAALQVAGEWATHFGGELVLVHVAEPPGSPGLLLSREQVAAGVQSEAAQRLQQLQARLPQLAHARLMVRQGSAAQEIARAVEEEGADLLAIATHGAGFWRSLVAGTPVERLLFGSVTNDVLRLTSCPILTVRMPDAAASGAA